MVEFCNNCGAIIMGKKGDEIKCPSCGNINKAKSSVKLSEKVENVVEKEVLSSESAAEIHPITNEFECPKCKCNQCYYWSKQTRASDEPETQFFKCVECSHQWRNYN